MSRILYLTLKKKWFDLIASGIKKQEYREINKYWAARFNPTGNLLDQCRWYDEIEFRNGYNKACPIMRILAGEITIGEGKEEWGAIPGREYYIINLGKILSIKNYTPLNTSTQ